MKTLLDKIKSCFDLQAKVNKKDKQINELRSLVINQTKKIQELRDDHSFITKAYIKSEALNRKKDRDNLELLKQLDTLASNNENMLKRLSECSMNIFLENKVG